MMNTPKIFIGIAVVAVAAAALPSCKPSEKNYKAAYELAQFKEREGLDDEIYAKMKTEGMPRLLMYGTDSVYVAPKEPLLISWQPGTSNKTVTTAPPFNLVIGEYRNPTNARSHAAQFMPPAANEKEGITEADTIPKGWDWYPMVLVQGAEDRYYVAIAHGDSVESLLPILRKFRNSGMKTVGADVPVVRTRR